MSDKAAGSEQGRRPSKEDIESDDFVQRDAESGSFAGDGSGGSQALRDDVSSKLGEGGEWPDMVDSD